MMHHEYGATLPGVNLYGMSRVKHPAPLSRHRVRDPGVGHGSLPAPIGARPHLVYPIRPPRNDVGRLKRGEILQPQARFLCLTVAMFPRLDILIRSPVLRTHDADRVLYGNPGDRRVHHFHEEVYRLLLSAVRPLLREPPGSRNGQVGAWGKGNHQIPPV